MSSRPVRVLHLRDSPWVDGPGRTILETATRIDRTRVDYHVGVFVSDENAQHPLVEAMHSRDLPVHAVADLGGAGREMVDRLLGLIDALQADILHTSEFRSNVLALLCRHRRRGLRIVSTAHGWIENDLRGRAYALADRLLLRGFDRVILVSQAMRRRLPEWWVSSTKVRGLRFCELNEDSAVLFKQGEQTYQPDDMDWSAVYGGECTVPTLAPGIYQIKLKNTLA